MKINEKTDIKSNPFISIVTPVYNCEKYLAECIESVIAQTYDNWEYVIVNNCSTDRSLEIAENYAQKDNRIRVHNNEEFLNVLQNLNHAMRQVSHESKYCKIVHADDWLFPNCLLEMVKLAEEHPSVGIVSSYVLEGSRVKGSGIPYPSHVMPGKEVCRWSLLHKIPYIFGSPTSLLIRSDQIRDRESFYNEAFHQLLDQTACYDILRDVDFGFVHQVLTYSRVHDESHTSSNEQIDRFQLESVFFLKEYGPIYLDSDEFKKLFELRLRRYYRFLVACFYQRKGKNFWTFHRKGLSQLGLSLKSAKFVRAAFLETYLKLLDILAHPKTFFRNLTGRSEERFKD
jgi:glycosyltransferase involved in cell wall biosynthesis